MTLILRLFTWLSLIAIILILGIVLGGSIEWILSGLKFNISKLNLLTICAIILIASFLLKILTPNNKSTKAEKFFLTSEKPKKKSLKTYDLSINPNPDEDKVILSMSGGGIKAGLFHLGGLKALNSGGKLSNIDAFSSVSGGSITNAWLAMNWSKLSFDKEGVARNFDKVIFDPLFEYYTQKSISYLTLLIGLLPFTTIADRIARSFDKNLYAGARLSNFPDPRTGPDFFIVSTDMRTNTAWYFGRDEIGPTGDNYKLGGVRDNFTLGQVVTASAAFPPFISPYVLKLKTPIKPSTNMKNLMKLSPNLAKEFTGKLILGDGGIYDNLGAEKIKGYRKAYVSNASSPFNILPGYRSNWLSQYDAIASRVHRQVEQRRKIHLGDLAAIKKIVFRLWEMDDILTPEAAKTFGGLDFDTAWKTGNYKVRLSKVSVDIASNLVIHGESLARRQIQK